ncbi:MAG: tetratricopeptide repeat protein, partial [Flavobacteriaceae bacterium]
YKRTDNGVHRLEDLGEICLEAQHYETAIELFEFIRENTPDPISRLNAQLNLIDIDLITKGEKIHEKAQKRYVEHMAAYGYAPQSLQLQVAYANFLAFQLGNAQEAIDILDKSLEMPLNAHGEAAIKLALGDILVFDQRFNQALIHFTQVQKRLKNDVLGQNARYKVAQTSFYKGDFDWAFTQLKVLRGSTSQLIANDAMQLSLLISDNSLEDSTQTALKKYARADLMAYQGKVPEALDILNDILENHKGEKIEDEALLRQGELLEAQGNLDAARFNFLKITEFYGDGILADDAHFALGELYRNKLNQPKKAQEHYEKIIYNYQDSYYYPHARRYFRRLRGDKVGEL